MRDTLDTESFFDQSQTEEVAKSTKAKRRAARRAERTDKQLRRTPKPIEPRTPRQAEYLQAIKTAELIFAVGPAGVGKTYVAARKFGEMLATGEIEKLYLARPNVSKAKHRNGFLPGTLEDKTAPWLVPIFEGLKDSMGPAAFEAFRKSKAIEEVPFEYIQGRTFANAGCIVDEAENLDIDDLYITLTRQGEGLTMVLAGDIHQARIPDSGLAEVIEMSRVHDMEAVAVITFEEADVVRSRQAKQWVRAFRARPAAPQNLPNFITFPQSRSAA